MKYALFSLSLLFGILSCSICLSSEQVTMRAKPDLPPFYFKTQTGEWDGIEVKMAQALAQEAKIAITFVDMPWGRAIFELKEGNLDMIAHCTRTKEREEFIEYIGETVPEQMALIVKNDNKEIKIETLDDFLKFDKRSFGIQIGVFYSEEFNKRIEEDKVFATYFAKFPDTLKCAQLTALGRYTGCFLDKIHAQYLIKNREEYKNLAVHNFSLSPEKYVYFGLSKKSLKERPKLKELFSAYNRLEEKGVFKSILNRWQ